ncbi:MULTISPECIES: hypothetical protein [Aquimarina]|uniref:hypothetical protein n=1 Tax=Aquimarina TaxID=290174 RepID=UPI000D68F71E|nr:MULTISPECIES: hypothetical protein [Aquimarina]
MKSLRSLSEFKIPKKELKFINGSGGTNGCLKSCSEACDIVDTSSRSDNFVGEGGSDDCKKTCKELCGVA